MTFSNAGKAFGRATTLFGALWVISLASNSYGQAVSQISGAVHDRSGAVIAGAQVTATQTGTDFKRSTVTDDAGNYVLTNLPLGPYRLEASKTGFSNYVQTGIVLQVGTAPEIPLTMSLGQVSESIQVEANVSQVETRSIGVGSVIENQRILDLPLNGRQPTDLITLGGSSVQTGFLAGYGMRTGALISVAGGSIEGVQYNWDGAPNINTLDGSGMPLPFPDALQEFKVSTSVQDASNSGHSGATVDSVTKSGSNAFHGDLFEFVRNYGANARDFFATAPDGLKRNQFGGTAGGAIKKDKLFFFAGYQGTLVRQTPISTLEFVPTADMLSGDFSTFASAACQNGRAINLGGPFVSNRISPALLSPAAVNIARRLPAAFDPCGRVLTGIINHENDNQGVTRVDYQLSAQHTLFARYMLTKQQLEIPYSLDHDPLTEGAPGFDDQAQSGTIGETYVISPSMVNSLRLSVNRIAAVKPGADMFGASAAGINAFSYDPNYLSLNVVGQFTVGSTTKNAFAYETNFGANDDFTITHGSHLFAFGGRYMRSIDWLVAQAFADGAYTISGSVTGSSMADFLLGDVSQLRQANPNPLNVRQNFFAVYAQDTWKVNPRLTLNYGLNWAPFLAATFPQGDTYNFNLARFYAGQRSTVIPNAPPGLTYPGDPGFHDNSGINSHWRNFDPRVGIAWDPFGDGKTAIRAGAGIAHDFVTHNQVINNESASPFRLTVISLGVKLDDPYATYPGGDPFPYNYNKSNPVFAPYGTYLPVPPNLNTQAQYSWNFGGQRQITPNWFVSATYLGTHIIHVWNAVELNPAQFIPGNCAAGQYGLRAPGPCTTSSNVNQRRLLNFSSPGTQLGYVTQYDDGGTQSYNGLLLATNWRMSGNVNLNFNYTWSHCVGLPLITLLNPGANYIHQAYQNIGPADRNLDVGDCLQDRRQVANLTLVAQTPRFANRVGRRLASGWTFASTVVARTGDPLTVVTGASPDIATGFGGNPPGTQRPNQVLADAASPTQNQSCGSPGSFCLQWLNPAAFQVPAAGTFGNTGYNNLRGPGFWEWDQAVSRQFRIREQQTLDFRIECFNPTNSLRPGDPATTLSAANTFGRILNDATPPPGISGPGVIGSATNAPARVFQFALKFLF
ncbi:MAG TPA: carboxypeptidase-like regulatory domain-containing protein [Bryobacteraceae bacterium]|nr:carboxypeptidase-like regulatory domain-containing protein [Bryobacteraceae bacterium]